MSDFKNIVAKIVDQQIKYSVPRLGRVLNVNDPLEKGRLLASVPLLGVDTEDQGVWVYPAQNSGLLTPSVGDWIIILWVDGRGAGGGDIRPFYVGRAAWMTGQLPENYQNPDTQILFESRENKIRVDFNESDNLLQIGAQGFQPAARQDDSTELNSTTDPTFWTWLSAVGTASGVGPPPGSAVGKITGGSSQVKIGDK